MNVSRIEQIDFAVMRVASLGTSAMREGPCLQLIDVAKGSLIEPISPLLLETVGVHTRVGLQLSFWYIGRISFVRLFRRACGWA